ncbi:hypothetical protein D4765_02685 [Subtercola vilae]|uniref:Uncharacterized protein n=1 Tax=Subtercola vilae TaxID=2056433 RepID=A0A4T2C8T0_9MICO|nr:hypothetical protein D4765_02685 [Subtercola vilae]
MRTGWRVGESAPRRTRGGGALKRATLAGRATADAQGLLPVLAVGESAQYRIDFTFGDRHE